MDRISSSSLGLQNIYSIRCNINGPLFCKRCESCKLIQKINLAKSWFNPLSYNSKRMFLERLIVLSEDIHDKIPGILRCLQSKDFQYTNSRIQHGPEIGKNKIDRIEENTNHSLDISKVENIIHQQYISWYVTSSEWTKKNFLMELLKLCTMHLIRSLQLFISELHSSHDENNNKTSESNLMDFRATSPIEFTKPLPKNFFGTNCDKSGIQKCQSAPLFRPKSAMKSGDSKKKRNYSAKERITFKDLVTTNYQNDDMERPLSQASSRLSKCPSKAVFLVRQNSSARCTPVLTPSEVKLEENMSNLFEDKTAPHQSGGIDFIRFLPIQISKKIFGYLSEENLTAVAIVSTHWKDLTNQVKKEIILKQIAKEDIMMMQPASAKVPHPRYMRNVPVHIPKLTKKGELILNCEATHIDVQVLYDEFVDINMEECYQGWETRKVLIEEKNIFCGSYNVLVIDCRKDIHRRIHWLGGNFVAMGSSDRKVQLRDIQTAENVRTIAGHSGSVKSVYIDEKNNMVVSGGYDTTVRVWDIRTGKCNFIFRGHKGSIIALTADHGMVVSSSTDSFIKVWNLETGRCKRTFYNKSIVYSIQIVNGMLLTGCSEGVVNLWNIENSAITKTFNGHKASITCVKYLKWHIVTGSLDSYVMLWSNVGDLTDCLKTFRHPREVLCLEVLYCRIITGCEDGKIRLWNMLNGDCLRVIRGNSKNDPIASLFAAESRLVVNTLSCVLGYHFEPVVWDSKAPRYRSEIGKLEPKKTAQRRPHSYHRAMKLQYNGSPLHKTQSFNFSPVNTPSNCNTPNNCNTRTFGNTRPSVISRSSSSIDQHIARIKSAKSLISLSSEQSALHGRDTPIQTVNPFQNLNDDKKLCEGEQNIHKHQATGKQIIRTRCRSAPAQRVITLPAGERGSSTSGDRVPRAGLHVNKMVMKPGVFPPNDYDETICINTTKPKTRCLSAKKPGPNTSLTDLKIKTCKIQLEFEKELRKKK